MAYDDQIQPCNTQDICTATVSLNTKLHILPFEHAWTPTCEGAPNSVWRGCADLETEWKFEESCALERAKNVPQTNV